MFKVIDNTDTILPQYPCGNRGPSVSANLHGEKWAVWKLVDDLDKHVGKPHNAHQKAKCQTCYENLYLGVDAAEDSLKVFMDEMAEAMKKATDVLNAAFGKSMEDTAKAMQDFILGLDVDAEEPYLDLVDMAIDREELNA